MANVDPSGAGYHAKTPSFAANENVHPSAVRVEQQRLVAGVSQGRVLSGTLEPAAPERDGGRAAMLPWYCGGRRCRADGLRDSSTDR